MGSRIRLIAHLVPRGPVVPQHCPQIQTLPHPHHHFMHFVYFLRTERSSCMTPSPHSCSVVPHRSSTPPPFSHNTHTHARSLSTRTNTPIRELRPRVGRADAVRADRWELQGTDGAASPAQATPPRYGSPLGGSPARYRSFGLHRDHLAAASPSPLKPSGASPGGPGSGFALRMQDLRPLEPAGGAWHHPQPTSSS